MNIFAGKSPTERNKIIAASVLGIMSLFSLYLAFGGSLFGSKTKITISASPSPSPGALPNQANQPPINKIPDDVILREWTTTPVLYNPDNYSAAGAGRNIFAFYEPPPPTPYSPTPIPPPKPLETPKPEPPPPPPITITFINPQSVYAGVKTFPLVVNGEKFTPDSQILFNGSALPTTFISANQLRANVPANLITNEGPRQISIVTPDPKLYSNQFLLNVQAPPRPQFQYYGIVARKRYNNDTAYVKEQGKQDVTSARLNDVIEGRFKLISISQNELVVEDVSLGFRHKVPLVSETATSGSGAGSVNVRGVGPGTTISPYNPPLSPNNPNIVNNPNINQQNIPGIPNNIPRYNPTPQTTKEEPDTDVDDGDGND